MASQHFRILIKSIGTAQPAASVAVASGLGLPTATVISRLYSAPAILIDGIDESIAKGMVKLLGGIGYEAEAQDSTLPSPAASPLYDIAVYIQNIQQFQHAIHVISDFTGMTEEDASRMILSPPGVILGSVSEATVKALTNRLGSGISVLSSLPDTAHYNLFLSKDMDKDKHSSAILHKRILQDLKDAELELLGSTGLVATHVKHTTAQQLWQRYQTSGLIRIVNEDFLRFDLILEKSLASSAITAEHIEILKELAEIPSDMSVEVLQAAPITLLESIPSTEIEHQMTAFTKAGLDVRADMITFQRLGLEVLSLSDNTVTQQALEGFGLHERGQPLPRPPFIMPELIPELRARIIRSALEDTGADVAFVEASV